MSEILRIREFETAGILAYNGSGDFHTHMWDWMRQGRRHWKPHGIQLPADEVHVPLVPVHKGREAGHNQPA